MKQFLFALMIIASLSFAIGLILGNKSETFSNAEIEQQYREENNIPEPTFINGNNGDTTSLYPYTLKQINVIDNPTRISVIYIAKDGEEYAYDYMSAEEFEETFGFIISTEE